MRELCWLNVERKNVKMLVSEIVLNHGLRNNRMIINDWGYYLIGISLITYSLIHTIEIVKIQLWVVESMPYMSNVMTRML